MSTRAQDLAAAFERANDELIATIEGCSDDQLQAVCNGEGWPIVVTAHHVALAYPAIAGMVLNLANNEPLPPVTPEMLDQANAQHAQDHASVSRDEALALLRSEGRAAADRVRDLTDEQLTRSAPVALAGGQTFSAGDMLQGALIGHAVDHGNSIRTAIAGGTAAVA